MAQNKRVPVVGYVCVKEPDSSKVDAVFDLLFQKVIKDKSTKTNKKILDKLIH